MARLAPSASLRSVVVVEVCAPRAVTVIATAQTVIVKMPDAFHTTVKLPPVTDCAPPK